MGEGFTFCMGICVGSIIFILFFAIISDSTDLRWKKECIQHGAAEYNQQTGEWQWKETPANVPETDQ